MSEVIHSMSHQKVQSGAQRGHSQITQEKVDRLLVVCKMNDYEHNDLYISILERWSKGDFSNAVDDHNEMWKIHQGGNEDALGKATREKEEKISFEYSNMIDNHTQNEIKHLLSQSEVSNDKIELFFKFVADFYKVPYEGIAENGFVSTPISDFTYNSFSIKITTKHWNELGFDDYDYDINCRVAAFTLIQDFIHLRSNYTKPIEIIDEVILDNHYLLDYKQKTKDRYALLFNNISVATEANKAEASNTIIQNWNDNGLYFKNDVPIKMISMYVQNRESEFIQVAHAAVLLETTDYLYLIEKYNPQQPYQVSKFRQINEIKTYLLQRLNQDKINTSQNIIIMQNNELIY